MATPFLERVPECFLSDIDIAYIFLLAALRELLAVLDRKKESDIID